MSAICMSDVRTDKSIKLWVEISKLSHKLCCKSGAVLQQHHVLLRPWDLAWRKHGLVEEL